MSIREKLEGLFDPVFLRLRKLRKTKNNTQRTRSTILLVLTSSSLLGAVGGRVLPVYCQGQINLIPDGNKRA